MKRLVCLLIVLAQCAISGTTGKIAGRIVDGATREPLPFANVTVEGTQMGATTDASGSYFIINIPVGTYKVRASMVGYSARAVTGVQVMADMTSTLDFRLSTQDVQADEVVVTATRPAIQQDRTSTKHVVDVETINAMPVTDFRQVIQVQAGVNGSHFRGGRFNEALFMVDGLQVKSPVNGYTGYTAGFSANLPQIGVDEIQVSTGGFEAEYGNAQSGIVNTLTRDPAARLSGRLRMRTSDFPWAKMKWKPNQYGSGLPDWKAVEAFVASPYADLFGGRIAVTGSADIQRTNRDFLAHEYSLRQSYTGKALYSAGDTKITLNSLLSKSTGNSYYHRYSYFGPLSEGYTSDFFQRATGTASDPILERYFFVPDARNYPAPAVISLTDSILFEGKKYGKVRNVYDVAMQKHISEPVNTTFNVGLSWTQTLSKSSFLEIKLSQFYTRFHEVVEDVADRNHNGNVTEGLYWRDNNSAAFPTAGHKDRQFINGYWYYTGDEGWWFDQLARTTSLRADYSNQFNQTNLLKAGVEANYNTGSVEKVTFESVTNPRFDVWGQDLLDLAGYIQDKIEVRDGFILNAGVRFDYYNPNGFSDVLYPENPADLSNPVRRANLTSADRVKSRWQISPRIGISHPITERDKIHFYYGHFFQRPDFRYLYENVNLDFRYSTNVDIGNPRLKPEKTVSYEVGWEHLFSDWLRFGVTGYYKDITNLVTANDFLIAGALESYQVFMNQDYANVRGLEFTFETLGLRQIQAMINYSYAFANGRSSTVFKGNGEIVPRRLDPLDWDVRHKINANIILRSFGAVQEWIGEAELSLLITASSGLPYTTNTRDLFPLFALRNDGRLPWRKNVDMRFRKSWLIGGFDLSVLAEVQNLFDWRNVEFIAGDREGLVTYEQTGDPRGPYLNPTTYSRPRVYRLGFEVQL